MPKTKALPAPVTRRPNRKMRDRLATIDHEIMAVSDPALAEYFRELRENVVAEWAALGFVLDALPPAPARLEAA